MSERPEVTECQRCGRGFLLTTTYIDWLARRGRRVVLPMLCPTCYTKAGPHPKQRGKVKWFDPRKHYGLIAADDGEDVYFHRRQIVQGDERGAHEGQAAWFHVRRASKGPEALNVELDGE